MGSVAVGKGWLLARGLFRKRVAVGERVAGGKMLAV